MWKVDFVKTGRNYTESLHATPESAIKRMLELKEEGCVIPQVFWVGNIYNGDGERKTTQTPTVTIDGYKLQEDGLLESIQDINTREKINRNFQEEVAKRFGKKDRKKARNN